MLARQLGPTIEERLASYPAVALVGARQSGKTTLALSLGGAYYDLEQDGDRLRLDLDWDRLCAGHDLVVLDEAQAWPDVFRRLRGAIDADRARAGRFLILGSVSPSLMAQVSESLAGRLSLIELTPFLWPEIAAGTSIDDLWLYGGYPDGGVLGGARFPQWQLDYLALLAQRDLPAWGLPARPELTGRLLRMLAALHGQAWNGSQVGQALALSYHTVNSYLDYLAGAFLVRRLEPFSANVGKRLARRPKVYWRDSGLLHALLGATDRTALVSQPWVGASWEGFVIEQAIGQLSSLGQSYRAFYFRTSDQYEVDLLLEYRGDLWAIEVKLTASPTSDDFRRVDKAADMVGATRRFLVSQTRQRAGDERRASVDLAGLLEELGRRRE